MQTPEEIYNLITNCLTHKQDVAKIVLSFNDYTNLLKQLNILDCPQITLMGIVVTHNTCVLDNCFAYELVPPYEPYDMIAQLQSSNQNLLDEVNRLNGENEKLRKQLSLVHTAHRGFII